jgi:hypothetical protein
MKLTFIECLPKAVRLGQKADTGFKGVTWSVILPRVRPQITQGNPDGPLLVVIQEKTSAKKTDLKGPWQEWRGLKDASGTSYDESMGMVTAADPF